jgi:hypothetical protein
LSISWTIWGTWVIKRRFITLGELEKMFYIFLNSIDWEIIGQGGMKFEKSLKSYSNDQWLLCKKQTWFNMANILHALMLNHNITRLSPPRCLTCLLGLQGVQWIRGLVVVRVSWPGHPRLYKKKVFKKKKKPSKSYKDEKSSYSMQTYL